MSESVCTYCGSRNPAQLARCQSCGAALPAPPPPEAGSSRAPVINISFVEQSAPPVTQTVISEVMPDIIKLTENLGISARAPVKMSFGAAVLRLGAEGIAVAAAALIIGFNGATYVNPSTSAWITPAAVAAGALTGACVPRCRQNAFFTMLLPPLGALLGTLMVMLFPDPPVFFPLGLIVATGGAIFLSLTGSQPYRALPLYNKLRPVTGALAGALFAWLGMLLTPLIHGG